MQLAPRYKLEVKLKPLKLIRRQARHRGQTIPPYRSHSLTHFLDQLIQRSLESLN